MDSLATYNIIAGIIGTLLLFFGYRFYKPSVFFGGFVLGAVAVFQYCVTTSHLAAYGAGACAGIIFGTLAVVFYELGVFFLGALWGCTLALLLNGLYLSRISYVACEGCNTLLWVALVGLGLLFGLLSLTLHEHSQDTEGHDPRKAIIYLKTAFPGAYLLVRSMGHFAGGYESELDVAKVVLPSTAYYGCLVGTVSMALFGSWIQMRYTHHEHCGCEDGGVAANLEERKALTR